MFSFLTVNVWAKALIFYSDLPLSFLKFRPYFYLSTN